MSSEKKVYIYIGSCVSLGDGVAIRAMADGARDISRRTFLRHVDRFDLNSLERQLGYASHPGRGLTMAGDWHVSYHRSAWRGRPCVYFRWSGIEHVFVWRS